MRNLFYILTIVLFVSCKEKTATDVYIFNNSTYHTIDLVLYEPLSTKEIKEYTTIALEKRSTDNSIFTRGRGNATAIENVYDSVLVTWDDTVKIIHYSQLGQPQDPSANHILDFSNWVYVQTTVAKKKESKRDLIYTFTEQDYLDAL